MQSRAGGNHPFEIRLAGQPVIQDLNSAEAVSVQNDRQTRITQARLFQGNIDILHEIFDGGNMPACPSRTSMPAQIRAKQDKAFPANCLGDMRVTRGMLAESMYQ